MNHKENWQRLGEYVSRTMEAKGVPGVAVGLLYKDEVAAEGFGVTHVEHPLPVTDETLFQIGSITKTFTGTALLRLVERGQVELDAPVRTYLPDFRVVDEEASALASVRHLLTHTGGWAGDFFRSTGAGDEALARYVAAMAELPQLAPLGRYWSYNNAGFSLVGYLIEVVTGQGYEAALQELVFEPLGLDHCFFDPGQVLTHRFAVGHREQDGEPQVARPWPLERSAYPAGGIVCHVRDLLNYARFQLGDGTARDGSRLLLVEAMAQMQAPQVAVRPGESWGLSWGVVDEIEGARQVRHGGGTNGQVSSLVLLPQHDLALAVLTNADHGGQLTEAVRRWVLKAYLDLEAPEPQGREAPEEELAEFVGSYPGFFANLDLGLLAGRLIGLMTYNRGFPNEEEPPPPTPPPATLDLCDTDRLLVLDGRMKGATVDAIRQPDGAIGWLRVSGRLHRREG